LLHLRAVARTLSDRVALERERVQFGAAAQVGDLGEIGDRVGFEVEHLQPICFHERREILHLIYDDVAVGPMDSLLSNHSTCAELARPKKEPIIGPIEKTVLEIFA
jgi:hypothetical protein